VEKINKMSKDDDPTHNLYFQDIVVIKHFIEKAFREKFFHDQEIKGMEKIHQKLENIIGQAISDNGKNNELDK
jgi:hypothetical protein